MRICLSTANTLTYPQGGVLWVFINWALGLLELGHDVLWFDVVNRQKLQGTVADAVQTLRGRLRPYGLDERIVIAEPEGRPLPSDDTPGCRPLDEALAADLLLDFRYDLPPEFVARFPRSVFMDIDPGILQLNIARGYLPVPTHRTLFTIGENLQGAGSAVPQIGRNWLRTRPVVHLKSWPVMPLNPSAPFTTVSHWRMDEWIVEMDGSYYKNDKRSGFEPFFDLPARVNQPLELAICLGGEIDEQRMLQDKGWRVREAHEVTPTAERFHQYIQHESAGEFGCAKPAYVKFGSAWISDRTACYLASGKPCVVQHTGDSDYLPEGDGLFRFKILDDAAGAFSRIADDYPKQSRQARRLAEDLFDSNKVIPDLLEQAG